MRAGAFARLYRRIGRGEFVAQMARHGIAAYRLADSPTNWVIMVRRSMIRNYRRGGVNPRADHTWSMWQGRLGDEDGRHVRTWFEAGGARHCHIHRSCLSG